MEYKYFRTDKTKKEIVQGEAKEIDSIFLTRVFLRSVEGIYPHSDIGCGYEGIVGHCFSDVQPCGVSRLNSITGDRIFLL